MNVARPHTDGVHSDNTPTESMIETPQTFAAKLKKVGYVEPVLPKSIGAATCTVRGCGQIAPPGKSMCRDCAEETTELARFMEAQRNYLRAARPTLWQRFRALLSRVSGGLFLLAAVLPTTLGCIAMARDLKAYDRRARVLLWLAIAAGVILAVGLAVSL